MQNAALGGRFYFACKEAQVLKTILLSFLIGTVLMLFANLFGSLAELCSIIKVVSAILDTLSLVFYYSSVLSVLYGLVVFVND